MKVTTLWAVYIIVLIIAIIIAAIIGCCGCCNAPWCVLAVLVTLFAAVFVWGLINTVEFDCEDQKNWLAGLLVFSLALPVIIMFFCACGCGGSYSGGGCGVVESCGQPAADPCATPQVHGTTTKVDYVCGETQCGETKCVPVAAKVVSRSHDAVGVNRGRGMYV
jgi:hypothetical protein